MHPVHIRRALLLFAIVLGLAALAASLARPPEERRSTERREPGPPTATPLPRAEPPAPLSFDAGEDQSRRLPAGRAATVEVSVDEAGGVEIPQLGLSGPADEFTPARFEVLPDAPGRYEIVFTPAAGGASRPVGTLVVTARG